MVKEGSPTITLNVVLAVVEPAVPVIVAVYVPATAEEAAEIVIWLP
jgi:hypothetical protein